MSNADAQLSVFSMFLYLLPICFAIGLAVEDGSSKHRPKPAAAKRPKRAKAKRVKVAKPKKAKKKKPEKWNEANTPRITKYWIGRDYAIYEDQNRMPL